MARELKPRRSCLSVPASSARMQAKAATLEADQVLFDLEDATAPSEKAGARSIVVDSLKTLDFGRRAVAVRVNGVDTLMRLLVAARANGLLAIDGPYAAFADLPGLERSARRTAALGYDGKWVIHPSQIETVNRVYSPDPVTYARAEGILAAYRLATEGEGRGAVRYEGEMIDEANRKMAESVARRGRWLGLNR